MADLYESAMPVMIIPDGVVGQDPVLFQDPLPVYVVNPTSSSPIVDSAIANLILDENTETHAALQLLIENTPLKLG